VSADDRIEVLGLDVIAQIGVPDAERTAPQRLKIDLTLWPERNFNEMQDSIALTPDYLTATRRVQALAAERPRRLIETLADDAAAMLLREFPVRRVRVRVRKFILADAEHVAAVCDRKP
jgi:dihydroneopterin aldolase